MNTLICLVLLYLSGSPWMIWYWLLPSSHHSFMISLNLNFVIVSGLSYENAAEWVKWDHLLAACDSPSRVLDAGILIFIMELISLISLSPWLPLMKLGLHFSYSMIFCWSTKIKNDILLCHVQFILPYLLGWHAYANTIKPNDPNRANNANSRYGGDFEWSRW